MTKREADKMREKIQYDAGGLTAEQEESLDRITELLDALDPRLLQYSVLSEQVVFHYVRYNEFAHDVLQASLNILKTSDQIWRT